MKTKRIGDIVPVENTERKFGSADHYNYMRGEFPDKTELPLLFTDNEIQVAIERAKENEEDLPKVSWFRNLID